MSVERLDTENCGDPLQAFLHKQRYDFVLSKLGTDDSVLEIGTGVGAFARMLLGHCASYIGIEYDSDLAIGKQVCIIFIDACKKMALL